MKNKTSSMENITDHDCVLGDIVRKPNQAPRSIAFVRARPREPVHFDPKEVNAAIVTCGGLCPALDNVIREITKTLYQICAIGGVVYGIQGGYLGFYDNDPAIVTPASVEDIHHNG